MTGNVSTLPPADEVGADGERWITPRAAAKQFGPAFGGEIATQHKIAHFLRCGKIRVQARHVWYSADPSYHAAWEGEENPDAYKRKSFTSEYEVIDRAIWLASDTWRDDVESWRWKGARFAVTVKPSPSLDRMFMRGIRFNFLDLKKNLDREMRATKSKGGRGPDYKNWSEFWHAVLKLAAGGSFQTGRVRSRKELKRLVNSMTSSMNVEDNQVGKELTTIWNLYGQAAHAKKDFPVK